MSRRTKFIAVCLIVLLPVFAAFLPAQVRSIPTTVDETPKKGSQDTQVVMQAKLVNARKILEGLVTQDFEMIETAASAMSKISLTPPPDLNKSGDQTDEQIYNHFRMEFARLAGQLERQARRKEPEATAYVQQNLTATCIACHDYIRDWHR